jgi:two-component system, cell cycle sensor histidine kinase and response regulator CckA
MKSRRSPTRASGDGLPPLARASKQIKAKIEEKFGFFPPFFAPALETPEILENLWQQTLSAYVNNPLPALFKEKLFAYLSRYCAVPYCIICHSCALRPLGMTATEILAFLTEPGPAAEAEISKHRDVLAAQSSPLEEWPAPGSALDESLMICSVFSFLNPAQAEDCRAQLRRLLGEEKSAYLTVFLCYVKTCHLWIEGRPELSYEADKRARENLGPLLAEEPRLGEFFRDYHELIARERQGQTEAALRQSEEKYRTLFESIDQGFCTIEVLFDENERPIDYRFLVVNPAFESQTGIENATGRRMREIAPLHEEHWFDIYGHIALTGEPIRFENTAEQLHRFYDVYAWRIGEPAERKVAILFNDITERRKIEHALRESEVRLAGIINSAMDAIISVDDGQCVILFNATAEKMFGYSSAEVIGQPISRLIPERFRASHEGHIRRFSATGETTRAMGALGAVSGLRRNGEEFPIEASISQLESGGQKLFTVILRDITERKRAEELLIEQATLLDQSHEAIIVRDLDNRIRYWGRGAERLYGWTAEEAVGRPVQELTYRESLSRLAEATGIVMENGKWDGEARHVTKDGREVIVEGHWTLVRDAEGDPKTILAINNDITEKKKLESQFLRAQRLESIGTLASGIAHDLNNILSPILTGTQMLQMKLQDESNQRLLGVMHASAERGAEMISQVLSFAKGAGGARVTIQSKHLIGEIVRVVEETFPKFLRITQRLSEGLWAISGDATQLQQVLINLCVNARDAMPQGGALTIEADNHTLDEIYAGMLKGASPGKYVVITIADTGQGIPPEIVDRIFDPFFTTKEPGRGTGLGLATVQGIVTSHGGFITVESRLGTGTTFKIYLPAHEAANRQEVEVRQHEILHGGGEIVLVIDDEEAIREMARTTLERFGYRALTADNGATALDVFASHKDEITIVITDMMMPVMDGPMTIRALQKLNPQVRIIASSGLTESIDAAGLDRLGIKTFLTKPYDAKTLLKTVAQALR